MSETVRFGELDISFDDRVLRPRPWTLAQATWAAELLSVRPQGRVLELCSGAGHIGLSLGLLAPHELLLVDIDPNASAHALANAQNAGLSHRVEVRTGPLQTALLPEETFSLILADPPWVRSCETSRFPFDPLLAIDGGEDGMEVARLCVEVIDRHLADDGEAILQLGSRAQCVDLANLLFAAPGIMLSIGEVREFCTDGVLVHLIRRDGSKVRCEDGKLRGFADCRGQWHTVDSWWSEGSRQPSPF
ncbi:MAG: methyltransferase [Aeromicrobium sp.]